MAINPSLLVSAAMLQDVLIDNITGLPMSNGVISLYQDNSRTTFKNWYYQSGSPGAYTYITLPNPMTLSAIGTITDGNGNDIIPFFYPYAETDNETPQLYYIVVVDSNGQGQFTRQNFPFGAFEENVPMIQTGSTLKNYVFNNVFWRNTGVLAATNVTSATIAPSAHDGFSMPDWTFYKSTTGAADTITFSKFAAGQFLNPASINPQNLDVTPEFFLNFTCSGTGAETYKYIQVPLSLHIKTLESAPCTLKFFARCNSSGGTGGNIISANILQFTGTGTTSPAVTVLESFTIPIEGSSTAPFEQIVLPFTMPAATGLTLGNGGDDALYLQIGYPLGQTFNIDIAKVGLYIGNNIPSNDFDTYDIADEVINSPRTGDVRISTNSFYPFGWVPCNNGTIGNASSSSTTRANMDTWQLFSLLWTLADPYDSGSNFNQICQLYTSAGSATNFGVSAIADFNANRQLGLTSMLGQVLVGTVPLAALLSPYSTTITASNGGGNLLITVSTTAGLYNGMPIAFTTTGSLPGNLETNHVYYITNLTSTTFNLSDTFAHMLTNTLIAWSSAGSNSSMLAPIPGSTTGEAQHTQQLIELASHAHSPIGPGSGGTPAFVIDKIAGSITLAGGGSTTGTQTATAVTGSSTPFNVMQNSTFYNIYMKL